MSLTLDEFMNSMQRYLYIEHPDFKTFYIRKGLRYIKGKKYACITIARIEAKKKGKGAFTQLINEIRTKYPNHVIYVESIFNIRFVAKLERLGFERDPADEGYSFYLKGKAHASDT